MSLLTALLPLLIVLIGISVMLFGRGGPGKLFRVLFAPIGCLIKSVVTIAVVVVVGLLLLANRFDLLKGLPVGGLPPIVTAPPSMPPVTSEGAARFLRRPFDDPQVMMSEGPRYSDSEAAAHFGAGLAFDYVKGDILGASSSWESFQVAAAADGVAIRSCEGADASTVAPFTEAQCNRGYGHFVVVRHDATDSEGRHYYTLYAHLTPDSIDPALPQRFKRDTEFANWKRVRAGERLGMSGQSGLTVCRGDCIHLHFEVLRGGYFRNPIDPYDISSLQDQKPREDYPEFTTLAKCGPDALWIDCPSPPSPGQALAVGDSVRVTEDEVTVRDGPGGAAIDMVAKDAQGILLSGPIYVYPHWWWEVAFGEQTDRWIAERYLQ